MQCCGSGSGRILNFLSDLDGNFRNKVRVYRATVSIMKNSKQDSDPEPDPESEPNVFKSRIRIKIRKRFIPDPQN